MYLSLDYFASFWESPSNNTEVGLETKTFFLVKRLLIRGGNHNVCECVCNIALTAFFVDEEK